MDCRNTAATCLTLVAVTHAFMSPQPATPQSRRSARRAATTAHVSAFWAAPKSRLSRTRLRAEEFFFENHGVATEVEERVAAEPDWTKGEFAARSAPMSPDADLSPESVASSCLRGLQFVDIPHKNAGLERAYNFMTLPCRVLVSDRGRQIENRGLDVFVERGLLSPLLQPFIGASRIDFGEMSVIDGTPTRGAMASVSVHIVASPLAATRHPSGIPKDTTELPEYTFAVRLQQDRRTKTWLVVDVIDAACVGSNRPL
mmetsp:Transcript_2081/g.6609  ORF Transcript_2081/g.6609 Transcript_2081/m.6609 type:complete len:258 (+) Transcript_2081:22-795(+)